MQLVTIRITGLGHEHLLHVVITRQKISKMEYVSKRNCLRSILCWLAKGSTPPSGFHCEPKGRFGSRSTAVGWSMAALKKSHESSLLDLLEVLLMRHKSELGIQ